MVISMKLKDLFIKYKQIILYLIVGGLTTIVNISCYFILTKAGLNTAISAAISWLASVVFAFFPNKLYVFESKKTGFIKEFIYFIFSRILTGIADILLMVIFVDIFHVNDLLMKVIANVLVIILNFVFSKIFIFNKEYADKDLKKYTPYLIILLVTLATMYPIFIPGQIEGHDTLFHFAQIYDVFYGLKNGHFLCQENHIIISFLGYNTRIFYSPLAHLLTGSIGYFLSFFGLSLMISYKIVLIFFCYLSGYFIYRFLKLITNSNRIALLGTILYLVVPYHIYNIIERNALAEVFATAFIPLFFEGLYRIIHKPLQEKGFIITICAMSLLILFHNITAFYTAFLGIIYLLINFQKIVKNFKKSKFVILSIISILITIMIPAFYYVGLTEHLLLGIYNISNDYLMHANIEYILSQSINDILIGIRRFANFKDVLLFLIDVLVMLVFVILNDRIVKLKLKPIYCILLGIIFGGIVLFVSQNIMFLWAYILATFLPKYIKIDLKVSFNYNNLFQFLILLGAILLLMFYTDIWRILPDIFYSIQFINLLWSFLSFFLVVILCLLLTIESVVNGFKVAIVGIICFCLTISTSNSNIVRKFHNGHNWYYEISEYIALHPFSGGWQQEYAPKMYYDIEYKSIYDNSLYQEVKDYLRYQQSNTIEEFPYLNPVVLEGKGNIEVVKRDVPNYVLNIQATEDVLIQLPLFYYKGYMAKSGNEVLEVIEIDGLVALKVNAGIHQVKISYEGSEAMQSSFYISIAGGVALALLVGYTSFKKFGEYEGV